MFEIGSTINNLVFDEKLNCYSLHIDFNEKSEREQEMNLLFPPSMSRYLKFWITHCMCLIFY
jgi:hypothetical protein